MQKIRVNVQIAGQTIPLSGENDESYIRSVADYVQQNVQAIEEKQPALSTTQSLILAALRITEELFTLKQQYSELDKRIDELRVLSAPQRPANKMPEKHPFEKHSIEKSASLEKGSFEKLGANK